MAELKLPHIRSPCTCIISKPACFASTAAFPNPLMIDVYKRQGVGDVEAERLDHRLAVLEVESHVFVDVGSPKLAGGLGRILFEVFSERHLLVKKTFR